MPKSKHRRKPGERASTHTERRRMRNWMRNLLLLSAFGPEPAGGYSAMQWHAADIMLSEGFSLEEAMACGKELIADGIIK